MVMPAIHLSRYQVRDLFTEVTGAEQSVDIQKLVKVARRELRPRYCEADMGISGANLAVAALEPDTQNSYFANHLITNLGDLARVMTPPALVFEETE